MERFLRYFHSNETEQFINPENLWKNQENRQQKINIKMDGKQSNNRQNDRQSSRKPSIKTGKRTKLERKPFAESGQEEIEILVHGARNILFKNDREVPSIFASVKDETDYD